MSVRSDHLFSKFTLTFGVVLAHWYALALVMGFQILARGEVGWISQLPVHSFGTEVWLGLFGGPVNADAFLLFFFAMVLIATIVFFMLFTFELVRSKLEARQYSVIDQPFKAEPTAPNFQAPINSEVKTTYPPELTVEEYPVGLNALLNGFRHNLNRL